MNRTTIALVVKAALGAGLALGFAAAPHGAAHADTPTVIIEEDSPSWDCRTMGNRICGPGNAQGVIPGDYTTVHPDGSPAWP